MSKLYIVHGWTYKPEPWEEVIKVLKDKYKIEAKLLRVPGLGTKSDDSFTIEDYVEWATKNIPKGSIALGHSNGGRILLKMLELKGSDYLKGLILFDAAGVYEPSKKNDISRILSKTFSPLKKSKFARNLVHSLLGVHDYNDAPENMKVTMTNMLEADKTIDFSKITTKTRLVWGSEDKLTPLRQGKKMHELLKNSTLTVKEGWRHSHYLQSIDETAAEVAAQYEELK
ncbi:alpha/beta hydrolase [Candidatus Saccharibacteria bacterium]|nr:alpha/beta hydrolase [Candidatus Saccharibacteria bacterium]